MTFPTFCLNIAQNYDEEHAYSLAEKATYMLLPTGIRHFLSKVLLIDPSTRTIRCLSECKRFQPVANDCIIEHDARMLNTTEQGDSQEQVGYFSTNYISTIFISPLVVGPFLCRIQMICRNLGVFNSASSSAYSSRMCGDDHGNFHFVNCSTNYCCCCCC